MADERGIGDNGAPVLIELDGRDANELLEMLDDQYTQGLLALNMANNVGAIKTRDEAREIITALEKVKALRDKVRSAIRNAC